MFRARLTAPAAAARSAGDSGAKGGAMELTRRQIMALAGAGSAALLLAALGFQAMGYAPCSLCILQRWPHLAAAVIAGLAWFTGGARGWAWLGAAAAATAFAFAAYHSGVEWRLWPGPSTCSGAADIAGMSVQDLLAKIEAAPVVRCDEVQWRFLGLSMAAWNALASAGLTVVWLVAATRAGLRLRRG